MYSKEYTILIICNGGKPYYAGTFSNFALAYHHLMNLVSLEQERKRPYYVDNDFFENEYPPMIKGLYLCVKEREVTAWQKYITCKDSQNTNTTKFPSSNIYKFPEILSK